MTKLKRLKALEVDTITAWHRAWQHSAVTFKRHTRDLDLDTADLLRRLELERPGMTAEGVEQEGRAFLEDIGIDSYDALTVWFSAYDLPDPDRPDLSTWPSDVPEPPDELPGEWERVLPFVDADDAVPRLAAQVFMFLLATARAVREDDGR